MSGKAGRRLARATAVAAVAVTVIGASAARADLQICNRTSYVLNLALGLETQGAAATRGWFRVDPGQCRTVLQGALEAEQVYVHARAHPVYGSSPLPQGTATELCVADGNFVIAGARKCPSAGQYLARFSVVKPSEVGDGLMANVAEEAEYDAEQARRAGVQRLLVAAGYDANPIDGIEGRKTEAALAQFLRDRKLAPEAATAATFFDTLVEAVRQTESGGLTWCNETPHVVMAALGEEEKGAVVTKGWYRVAPGRCFKPEVAGRPRRLYSFAEAVDGEGQVLKRGDKPLAWGGTTQLCTRTLKFEIDDHKDCADRGLTAVGFAIVELAGRSGATVRFRE
jgi:uncharacterized membrane protein